MKAFPIALVLLALICVVLLSWELSRNEKPTPQRMVPIARLAAHQAAPASPVTDPAEEASEPFAKKLPKLTTAKVSDLEARATSMVRKMDVATLDPQLPSGKFEEWFRKTMGPEDSYTWELNDCGEATGNPAIDQNRDMPICVEARAQSPQEAEMETSVILQVGTERKGLFARPVLRGIVQQEGEEFIDIKSLHDLPNQVPVN